MSAATLRRTTARVVPDDGATFVNDSSWFAVALEADAETLHRRDETEQILGHRWWHPDELATRGSVNHETLPAFVRAAVAHVVTRP